MSTKVGDTEKTRVGCVVDSVQPEYGRREGPTITWEHRDVKTPELPPR